jgi:non-haem Fe2+, alpha-ketoglutarate-dependent halogenase
MHGGLSSSLFRAFRRDGIAFPIRVLSPARASALRGAFEALEAGIGGPPRALRWTHLWFPWAYELILEPTVLDAVEALLGPEIVVMGTIILCKHPGGNARVAWHQDKAYGTAEQAPTVSAWVALADSTPANGCMRVIPGTHHTLLAHHDVPDTSNLTRTEQTLTAAIEETRAVDVVLRAGEMSLHHDLIIHSSLANEARDKRIGFVVRYTTPAFRARGFPVVRARGTASCPHLALAAPPQQAEQGTAVAAYLKWCASVERRRQPAAAVDD